jgi:hypothetical protein
MVSTIADRVRESAERGFVGRRRELEELCAATGAQEAPFLVAFVHGPGGSARAAWCAGCCPGCRRRYGGCISTGVMLSQHRRVSAERSANPPTPRQHSGDAMVSTDAGTSQVPPERSGGGHGHTRHVSGRLPVKRQQGETLLRAASSAWHADSATSPSRLRTAPAKRRTTPSLKRIAPAVLLSRTILRLKQPAQ